MLIEDAEITIPSGTLRLPSSVFGSGSIYVQDVAATFGSVGLTVGDATRPGYMAINTADGTRRGYVGWKSSTGNYMLLASENGWLWKFNQAPVNVSDNPYVATNGTSTADYLSRWSASGILTNSVIRDNGTTVGVNTAPTSFSLITFLQNWASASGGEQYGIFSTANYSAADSGGIKQNLRLNLTLSHTTGTQAGAANLLSYVQITGSGGTATSISGHYSSGAISDGATVTAFYHSRALNVAKSGSATGVITTQYGYSVEDLTSGATNIAFNGLVSSGSNKWNLYLAGTAANYVNGDLRIGTTTQDGTSKLTVNGFVSSLSKFISNSTQPGIILLESDALTSSKWIDVESGVLRIMTFNGNVASPSGYVNEALISSYGLRFTTVNTYGVSFWNSDSYKIWMSASGDATWGGVFHSDTSDYNMYFGMTNGAGRGFVFKDSVGVLGQITATAARFRSSLYGLDVGARSNSDHASSIQAFGYRHFRFGGPSHVGWYRVARFQVPAANYAGLSFNGTYMDYRTNSLGAVPTEYAFQGYVRGGATTATIVGDGSGATIRLICNGITGAITSVIVLTGGSGYTTATVSLTGGIGGGANLTVNLVYGVVVSVTVNAGGANYLYDDGQLFIAPYSDVTTQRTTPRVRLVRIGLRDWELQAASGSFQGAHIVWKVAMNYTNSSTVTYYDTSISLTAAHATGPGTVTTAGNTTITGSGTALTQDFAVGEILTIQGEAGGFTLSSIGGTTSAVINQAASTSGSGKTYTFARPSIAGTVEVTNGSATVTGTGTTFSTSVVVGDTIRIGGDTTVYTVTDIQSDTSLTVTPVVVRSSASDLTFFSKVASSTLLPNATAKSSGGRAFVHLQSATSKFGRPASEMTTTEVAAEVTGFIRVNQSTVLPAASINTQGSNAKDCFIGPYFYNNKIVYSYNQAGTVYYIWIPLDNTTTTWTHGTTPP